jgi:hypothetical protein
MPCLGAPVAAPRGQPVMTVRRSADQAAAIGSAQAKSRQNVAERATELTKSGRDSGGSQASGDSRNVDCHVRRHPSRRDRTLRRGPGDAPERDPAAHLKAPVAAVETGCRIPAPKRTKPPRPIPGQGTTTPRVAIQRSSRACASRSRCRPCLVRRSKISCAVRAHSVSTRNWASRS